VEAFRDAGIDVFTTMNIQHLESLNDQIYLISGVRVRETLPDWVVRQADEVVMVDLTPGALLNRLQRGVVYGHEKTQRALQNFFREQTLVALRELALRQAAHEVEHRMASDHDGQQLSGGAGKRHKILVLVTANPKSAMVIRRAKRVSDFLGAECFAVAVQPTGDLTGLPMPDRAATEQHLNFARNLHIETRILEGEDVATTLVDFARRNQVTQIFLTRPRQKGWSLGLPRDPAQKVIDLAKDMLIVIVSDRDPVAR
jgi:two-component system sensor histidine kinase KdpD